MKYDVYQYMNAYFQKNDRAISLSTVYRWMREGRLKARKKDGKWYITGGLNVKPQKPGRKKENAR